MQLDTMISFDGNVLSSNNMRGTLQEDTAMSPTTVPIWVSRAGAWPILAGKDFRGQVLNVDITCEGNYNAQLESVVKWFAPSDETPRQLIFKDTAANLQWYVYASAYQISPQDGGHVVISLAVDDPVWQSVILHTQTWNVSTNSTTDIAVAGNQPSFPIFEITPNTYPINGWINSIFVEVYATSTDSWRARPLDLTNGGWNTSALKASTDNYCLINAGAGISSDTDVIPYDGLVGAFPASGWFMIDNEQIYYTAKTGTTSGNFTGCTRAMGGTSAATHVDNSVVALSYIAADGRDVRVFRDGVEIDYWFGTGANAFGTTATKIFIVDSMPEKTQMTLKTAIAATGTPSTIDLNYTIANKAAISSIDAGGRVIIGSEEFTFTARTITATSLSLTVGERAVRNTTAALHAANSNVIVLAADYCIVYNNSLASAPDIDNTVKPIIDLTSSNSSFVYTLFRDGPGKRAGDWVGSVIRQSSAAYSSNYIYTGVDDAGNVYPAPIAGMAIKAFQMAGVWRPETAVVAWVGRFTDTVSEITSISGEKYQKTASWPFAALQGSTDGITWSTLKGEAASSATDYSTWVNWSYSSSDITVPAETKHLRLVFSGTVSQVANNIARYGMTAITVGMTNVPSVTMRTAQSNYNFGGTMSNSLGESFSVLYPLKINQTIIIDTNPDFPTAKFNGRIVNGAIKTSRIRPDWLSAYPGTESFTFAADYFGTFTIVIKWRDRMLFK